MLPRPHASPSLRSRAAFIETITVFSQIIRIAIHCSSPSCSAPPLFSALYLCSFLPPYFFSSFSSPYPTLFFPVDWCLAADSPHNFHLCLTFCSFHLTVFGTPVSVYIFFQATFPSPFPPPPERTFFSIFFTGFVDQGFPSPLVLGFQSLSHRAYCARFRFLQGPFFFFPPPPFHIFGKIIVAQPLMHRHIDQATFLEVVRIPAMFFRPFSCFFSLLPFLLRVFVSGGPVFFLTPPM